ncbi:MAG: hypothetical protein AAF490_16805 [Chloroflexota bacterium]
MKRLLSFCLIVLTAVFALAACGGQTAVEVEAEPEVSSAVEETVVEEEEVVVEAAAVAHDPFDLTLIGNTGRPQFLNAYASW